jgi:hypothetical protein
MGYNYPIIGGKNGLVVPLPMPPRPGIGGAISFASGAVAAAVLKTLIFLHTEPEFASDDEEVLQTVNEIMG